METRDEVYTYSYTHTHINDSLLADLRRSGGGKTRETEKVGQPVFSGGRVFFFPLLQNVNKTTDV